MTLLYTNIQTSEAKYRPVPDKAITRILTAPLLATL